MKEALAVRKQNVVSQTIMKQMIMIKMKLTKTNKLHAMISDDLKVKNDETETEEKKAEQNVKSDEFVKGYSGFVIDKKDTK